MNRKRWRRAQGALEAPLPLWVVYARGLWVGLQSSTLSLFFFFFYTCFAVHLKKGAISRGWPVPDVTKIGPVGLFRDAAERGILFFFAFFVYTRPSGSYIKLLLGIGEGKWVRKSHTGALMTQMCQKVPWRTSVGFITVRKHNKTSFPRPWLMRYSETGGSP